jgi:hypothetical protein
VCVCVSDLCYLPEYYVRTMVVSTSHSTHICGCAASCQPCRWCYVRCVTNHRNLFHPPQAALSSKSLLAGTLGRSVGLADILHDLTRLVGDELISRADPLEVHEDGQFH